MARIELNEQMIQADNILLEFQEQFHTLLNKKLNESNEKKQKNFELLRPTFANPEKKHDLQIINDQEKLRQDNIQKFLNQLRSNTIVKNYFHKHFIPSFQEEIQSNAQVTMDSLATNSERLLILFDEILTADEITKTSIQE